MNIKSRSDCHILKIISHNKKLRTVTYRHHRVGFQVLTAARMKMAVWVVAPCNLVEVCRRFRGDCCHHH
jgi:hypothetical protein